MSCTSGSLMSTPVISTLTHVLSTSTPVISMSTVVSVVLSTMLFSIASRIAVYPASPIPVISSTVLLSIVSGL